jgi:uncharacterized membrane protein YdbT with pleckstrin-like domain
LSCRGLCEDNVTDQQNLTGELNWFEGSVFVVAVVLFAIALAVVWLLKAVTGYPKFVVEIR